MKTVWPTECVQRIREEDESGRNCEFDCFHKLRVLSMRGVAEDAEEGLEFLSSSLEQPFESSSV